MEDILCATVVGLSKSMPMGERDEVQLVEWGSGKNAMSIVKMKDLEGKTFFNVEEILFVLSDFGL